MRRWVFPVLFILEFCLFGFMLYSLHLGEFTFMIIPYIGGGLVIGGLLSLLWVYVLAAFETVDRMFWMAAFSVFPVFTFLNGQSTSLEKWLVACSAAMFLMATIVLVELSGYQRKVVVTDNLDLKVGSLFEYHFRSSNREGFVKRPRRSFRKPRFYRRPQRRHYRDMY